MYILGLTGPIASGKSTVSDFFKQEHIPVIDADEIVHDAYTKGTPVHTELLALLGEDIQNPQTGDIDRKKLSALMKASPELSKKVESIVHPQVRLVMKAQLTHAHSRTSKMVVLAVPLMFEGGFSQLCDSVISCICDDEKRHHRFLERAGNTEEKWQWISGKQMTSAEYMERSDDVIPTDGSLEETKNKVLFLIEKHSGEEGKVWHEKWREI